jgi:hypothetical protein
MFNIFALDAAGTAPLPDITGERLDLHLHARRHSIAAAQASISSSFFSVLPPSCFSVALPW